MTRLASGLGAFIIAIDPDQARVLEDVMSANQVVVHGVIGVVPERAPGGWHAQKIIERRGANISVSEYGCALSHAKVYEAALEIGLDWVLVVEEDVAISRSLDPLVHIVSSLDSSDPIVVTMAFRGQSFLEPRTVRRSPQYGCSFEFRYVPQQTSLYVMSLGALKIAAGSEIDGPADWPSWARKIKFLGLYPPPGEETYQSSTVIKSQKRSTGSEVMMLLKASLRGELHRDDRYKDLVFAILLPKIEAWLWRRRGRPRLALVGQGPWIPVLPERVIQKLKQWAQS